jgi:hypothetical protein
LIPAWLNAQDIYSTPLQVSICNVIFPALPFRFIESGFTTFEHITKYQKPAFLSKNQISLSSKGEIDRYCPCAMYLLVYDYSSLINNAGRATTQY